MSSSARWSSPLTGFARRCAKAPMFYKESSEAGVGAAMKASIPMKKGYIETEGIVADID